MDFAVSRVHRIAGPQRRGPPGGGTPPPPQSHVHLYPYCTPGRKCEAVRVPVGLASVSRRGVLLGDSFESIGQNLWTLRLRGYGRTVGRTFRHHLPESTPRDFFFLAGAFFLGAAFFSGAPFFLGAAFFLAGAFFLGAAFFLAGAFFLGAAFFLAGAFFLGAAFFLGVAFLAIFAPFVGEKLPSRYTKNTDDPYSKFTRSRPRSRSPIARSASSVPMPGSESPGSGEYVDTASGAARQRPELDRLMGVIK